MQYPFTRIPPYDAQAIHDTIERALAGAGLDTTSGPMREVSDTIRRALAVPPASGGEVIDVPARVVDGETAAATLPPAAGGWLSHEYRNAAGVRAYRVHLPAAAASAPRPMLVMLHGCTQTPEDFAAGTRMNRLADEHGFIVVYPEQAAQANPSRCWNWFQAQDQKRDAGEPSLIAGIVREVAQRHDVDPGRIYVAGLSAGGAMAVVLGESYPELFAGVGVHSGLPYASAHDIPSAMAAMKGGRGGLSRAASQRMSAPAVSKVAKRAVPTIVFHGDRDHTVRETNAQEIVRQTVEAHQAQAGGQQFQTVIENGTATGGRRYTRTSYREPTGPARIEFWSLHGAGHAWSGGDLSGSYTEANGPDASAEMARFFLALPRLD
ncbi:extracellular catalytic domain type 1 short-chain-length polyhydroxyalkanoate depolymerase [Rubrivivax gelatinosus]|uniref:extracellular catalytic domain type 1 short-chain-length polyhydroxyalkanoate depolymerase n=1 Tax=Rubrivivax gelatinosus TaxID=28068 RepID=UPI0002D44543|nr:PHB depolymerase family esterase [Rubrivivax gelatinosus]MBG6078905.1 poly(hydroxyalkanoate) depolymerase family esterase [Rubrivivax gelatinosus]